jgi:WhiB family transcriptional regulator, redox-sensing transcriptional regulator
MNTSWREFARCRGVDPEIFYPVSDEEEAADEAKAICALCPVREPCLEFALETNQKYGIWGGLTDKERASLKRRRARARRAS